MRRIIGAECREFIRHFRLGMIAVDRREQASDCAMQRQFGDRHASCDLQLREGGVDFGFGAVAIEARMHCLQRTAQQSDIARRFCGAQQACGVTRRGIGGGWHGSGCTR